MPQRVKTAKNVKFVKLANTEEEGKLRMKEDDLEGIKYLFFTNMMKSSQVFFRSMMELSQMEFDEEENYEIFATKIPPEQQNTLEVIAAKQIKY